MQMSYVFILSSLDAMNEAIMSERQNDSMKISIKLLGQNSRAQLTKYHKHVGQERVDAGHGAEHLADRVDDGQIGETVEQINRKEHHCAGSKNGPAN